MNLFVLFREIYACIYDVGVFVYVGVCMWGWGRGFHISIFGGDY